jgi:branched-chain amino acid aminotransferase
MKVIYNGDLVDLQDSGCNELGWLKGSGIFETIKTVDSKPWAFSRHMRRAVAGALTLGIPIPSEDAIRNAVESLCGDQAHSEGMLRLCFADDGSWAAVHLPYTPMKRAAVVVSYSDFTSTNGQQIKTYPYDHRLQILESIKSRGADEALIKNHAGKVCEGAVTNLLFLIDGQWVTPPISDGVLPGVMRALVIEYCGVLVRSVQPEDLLRADSALLLSSLRIAQPVASIDGRELVQPYEFTAQIEAMALRTSVG